MDEKNALFQKYCLEDLERFAKHSSNPDVLRGIVNDHFDNKVICAYVAENRHCDSKTLELLSTHPCETVRIKVAENSYRITSSKVLVRLCLDTRKVKIALSNRTNDDSIIAILLRGNKNDKDIVGNCLRRQKSSDRMSSYITSATKEKLSMHLEDILNNPNIDEVCLKLLTEKGLLCATEDDNKI